MLDRDFLLLPTLILLGYEPQASSGYQCPGRLPPSCSALLPHLATAKVDLQLAGLLVVLGAAGSFAGARITSRYVPAKRLKQLYGVLMVLMTAYRLYQTFT